MISGDEGVSVQMGDDVTGGVVSHRIHPPFIPGVLDGCKAGVQGVAPALSVQNHV